MTPHQRAYMLAINAGVYMLLLRRCGVQTPTVSPQAMIDVVEGR